MEHLQDFTDVTNTLENKGVKRWQRVTAVSMGESYDPAEVVTTITASPMTESPDFERYSVFTTDDIRRGSSRRWLTVEDFAAHGAFFVEGAHNRTCDVVERFKETYLEEPSFRPEDEDDEDRATREAYLTRFRVSRHNYYGCQQWFSIIWDTNEIPYDEDGRRCFEEAVMAASGEIQVWRVEAVTYVELQSEWRTFRVTIDSNMEHLDSEYFYIKKMISENFDLSVPTSEVVREAIRRFVAAERFRETEEFLTWAAEAIEG
jgi:hypothetical protein